MRKSIVVYSIITIIIMALTLGMCLARPEEVDSIQRLNCATFTIFIGFVVLFVAIASIGLTDVSAEVIASGYAAILAGMGTILKNPVIPSDAVIVGVVTFGVSIAIPIGANLRWVISEVKKNLESKNSKKLVSYLVKILFFFIDVLIDFGILYYIPRLI